MTSIIKLEALSGVQDDGPLCYLLQVDQVYILLDCGWDEHFDLAYIDAIKMRIPQINALLISFGDVPHIGALPYLVKCGLNCPIYATVPVYKMGQLFLYDWLNGLSSVTPFNLFSFDDIDAAFDKVQQVKYSQTILLKGDNGFQITPFPAGHHIGGAIWRITKMGEEEIVYAVDFNHKKERHLNGCTFDGIGRPNLLITDAFNALYNQPKQKQRDENLVSKLLSTVRDGGDVMIVIDTAGRVLEIAHLLDQLWQNKEAGLMTYNLVMLSAVASSVIESAKSQVEWMSDKILRMFELGRQNPFQLKHVRFCHTLVDLNRVRSPKVVLVSGLDMESGFSRELFLEWSTDTKNMVIVTGRTGDRTLCSKLIRIAESREKKRATNNTVTLEVKRRVRLEGAELEQYMIKKREREQEDAKRRLETLRRNARLENVESSEESEDEETLAASVAALTQGGNKSTANNANPKQIEEQRRDSIVSQKHPKGIANANNLVNISNNYDIMWRFEMNQRVSFFKQNKKQFPMFPYQEEKSKWDDYGEIIRPEEYMTEETAVTNTSTSPTIKTKTEKEEMIDEEISDAKAERQRIQQIIEEWPKKCVSFITKIEILCKVEFIDFEGRSDGESIKKILSQIKPKQLVIVHGSAPATRHLAEYCRQNNIVQGKIFTPLLGEVVDATIESHIFQVTLSDQLMSSLLFQTVKDAELSWLDARIIRKSAILPSALERSDEEIIEEINIVKINGEEIIEDEGRKENDEPMELDSGQIDDEIMKRGKQGSEQEMEQANLEDKNEIEAVSLKTTVPVPDQLFFELLSSNAIPPHQSVFVNDPKLTDLKQLLASSGFHAEFHSGVLYVNNIANIRRNEAGRFHVEGFACSEYYKIREIIYSQFAIV
ncbi:Cleavage and polyadenylation specificity factor subunit 2 [Meloidogyne graminicola]|uniref:Cleavage and polyadenylation specificity factor subunit 2 n=1 Tax=Meloidogyne graminicola TaxID=189291 RepID=A0A8T0A0L5_9BILA|nr:Cleavage and polyadenylation specificity factor subunit 2 [Meloidogyne graminicola]